MAGFLSLNIIDDDNHVLFFYYYDWLYIYLLDSLVDLFDYPFQVAEIPFRCEPLVRLRFAPSIPEPSSAHGLDYQLEFSRRDKFIIRKKIHQ